MNSSHPSYRGHRFPAEIISHCVWLYFRFSNSFRDVEEMMSERGVAVMPASPRDIVRNDVKEKLAQGEVVMLPILLHQNR